MSGQDIDPKLLGRLAQGLEESGAALKTLQAQLTQAHGDVRAARTELDSAHARIKALEHRINGNGSDGLHTEMALLKSKVDGVEGSVTKIQNWREKLGDKKIESLESANKDVRSRNLQIWLAIGAMVIALGSMVGSCGPQWIKGVSPGKGDSSAVP